MGSSAGEDETSEYDAPSDRRSAPEYAFSSSSGENYTILQGLTEHLADRASRIAEEAVWEAPEVASVSNALSKSQGAGSYRGGFNPASYYIDAATFGDAEKDTLLEPWQDGGRAGMEGRHAARACVSSSSHASSIKSGGAAHGSVVGIGPLQGGVGAESSQSKGASDAGAHGSESVAAGRRFASGKAIQQRDRSDSEKVDSAASMSVGDVADDLGRRLIDGSLNRSGLNVAGSASHTSSKSRGAASSGAASSGAGLEYGFSSEQDTVLRGLTEHVSEAAMRIATEAVHASIGPSSSSQDSSKRPSGETAMAAAQGGRSLDAAAVSAWAVQPPTSGPASVCDTEEPAGASISSRASSKGCEARRLFGTVVHAGDARRMEDAIIHRQATEEDLRSKYSADTEEADKYSDARRLLADLSRGGTARASRLEEKLIHRQPTEEDLQVNRSGEAKRLIAAVTRGGAERARRAEHGIIHRQPTEEDLRQEHCEARRLLADVTRGGNARASRLEEKLIHRQPTEEDLQVDRSSDARQLLAAVSRGGPQRASRHEAKLIHRQATEEHVQREDCDARLLIADVTRGGRQRASRLEENIIHRQPTEEDTEVDGEEGHGVLGNLMRGGNIARLEEQHALRQKTKEPSPDEVAEQIEKELCEARRVIGSVMRGGDGAKLEHEFAKRQRTHTPPDVKKAEEGVCEARRLIGSVMRGGDMAKLEDEFVRRQRTHTPPNVNSVDEELCEAQRLIALVMRGGDVGRLEEQAILRKQTEEDPGQIAEGSESVEFSCEAKRLLGSVMRGGNVAVLEEQFMQCRPTHEPPADSEIEWELSEAQRLIAAVMRGGDIGRLEEERVLRQPTDEGAPGGGHDVVTPHDECEARRLLGSVMRGGDMSLLQEQKILRARTDDEIYVSSTTANEDQGLSESRKLVGSVMRGGDIAVLPEQKVSRKPTEEVLETHEAAGRGLAEELKLGRASEAERLAAGATMVDDDLARDLAEHEILRQRTDEILETRVSAGVDDVAELEMGRDSEAKRLVATVTLVDDDMARDLAEHEILRQRTDEILETQESGILDDAEERHHERESEAKRLVATVTLVDDDIARALEEQEQEELRRQTTDDGCVSQEAEERECEARRLAASVLRGGNTGRLEEERILRMPTDEEVISAGTDVPSDEKHCEARRLIGSLMRGGDVAKLEDYLVQRRPTVDEIRAAIVEEALSESQQLIGSIMRGGDFIALASAGKGSAAEVSNPPSDKSVNAPDATARKHSERAEEADASLAPDQRKASDAAGESEAFKSSTEKRTADVPAGNKSAERRTDSHVVAEQISSVVAETKAPVGTAEKRALGAVSQKKDSKRGEPPPVPPKTSGPRSREGSKEKPSSSREPSSKLPHLASGVARESSKKQEHSQKPRGRDVPHVSRPAGTHKAPFPDSREPASAPAAGVVPPDTAATKTASSEPEVARTDTRTDVRPVVPAAETGPAAHTGASGRPAGAIGATDVSAEPAVVCGAQAVGAGPGTRQKVAAEPVGAASSTAASGESLTAKAVVEGPVSAEKAAPATDDARNKPAPPREPVPPPGGPRKPRSAGADGGVAAGESPKRRAARERRQKKANAAKTEQTATVASGGSPRAGPKTSSPRGEKRLRPAPAAEVTLAGEVSLMAALVSDESYEQISVLNGQLAQLYAELTLARADLDVARRHADRPDTSDRSSDRVGAKERAYYEEILGGLLAENTQMRGELDRELQRTRPRSGCGDADAEARLRRDCERLRGELADAKAENAHLRIRCGSGTEEVASAEAPSDGKHDKRQKSGLSGGAGLTYEFQRCELENRRLNSRNKALSEKMKKLMTIVESQSAQLKGLQASVLRSGVGPPSSGAGTAALSVGVSTRKPR